MKINTIELIISAVRESQYPSDKLKEFLLVGRSNVGKSSFINSILSRKNLAYTSSRPGKTQTLNFYLVNDTFYLVDVPGYGYANVSKEKQKKFGLMIEDYIKNRDNLKRVFLLVDYRHKPTEDDFNDITIQGNIAYKKFFEDQPIYVVENESQNIDDVAKTIQNLVSSWTKKDKVL